MGILDKIMFWKRKEVPLGAEPGLRMEAGLPSGEMPRMEPGLPTEKEMGWGEEAPPRETGFPGMRASPSMPAGPGSFGEQQQFAQASTLAKDMEIISAKLDAVRATLENVNQRIAHLERIAAGESESEIQRKPKYW